MNVRERILAAYRELAREKGFYRMTVDELAARAGISKRTLYRYFRSKEEIIDAAIDQFMAEMAVTVSHLVEVEHDPEAFLQIILDQLVKNGNFIINPVTLNDLRLHYPHLWNKIDSFRLERIQIIVKYWLNQSDNQIKKDIDPRIITAVVTACIQAVLSPDFIINNGFTFESAAQQLSRFLSAALK